MVVPNRAEAAAIAAATSCLDTVDLGIEQEEVVIPELFHQVSSRSRPLVHHRRLVLEMWPDLERIHVGYVFPIRVAVPHFAHVLERSLGAPGFHQVVERFLARSTHDSGNLGHEHVCWPEADVMATNDDWHVWANHLAYFPG